MSVPWVKRTNSGSCWKPLLCRVSDAGHEGWSHVHSDRRPKAAKERTRGRWSAEGAAHSAMGIWLTRKVRAKERNALGRVYSITAKGAAALHEADGND